MSSFWPLGCSVTAWWHARLPGGLYVSEPFTYQIYHTRQKLPDGPTHELVFAITSWHDLRIARSRPLALTSLCAQASARSSRWQVLYDAQGLALCKWGGPFHDYFAVPYKPMSLSLSCHKTDQTEGRKSTKGKTVLRSCHHDPRPNGLM